MTAIAALVTLLIVFTYPPLGMPAIIATVNLYAWRRHRADARERRARAEARAEERRTRDLIAAARYFNGG